MRNPVFAFPSGGEDRQNHVVFTEQYAVYTFNSYRSPFIPHNPDNADLRFPVLN
ncbi:MAG: hypothetical protein LBD71_02020 [Treponema sp.]|nr:hypothetical protein [Treponema sp.]